MRFLFRTPREWRTSRQERHLKPYIFEGHRFEYRSRGYGCYEMLVDGVVVPKDVDLAMAEIWYERPRIAKRGIVYWVTKPFEDDDICCRYCRWTDVAGEAHQLGIELERDKKRKAIDPEKFLPEDRALLEARWVRLHLCMANIEEGADAIYEGRRPEWFTLTASDEATDDQWALFTMAEVIRQGGKTTPRPVKREVEPPVQAALF